MIHADLDLGRHDTAKTVRDLAHVVEQTQGNDTPVATVGGKTLTVADLGQLLAAVSSVVTTRQNDKLPGYEWARRHVLFGVGWALHALGVSQARPRR